MPKRHIGKERATLCGEWSAGDAVDNFLPDCESCQLVEAHIDGATVAELAGAHAMPISLVEDVLESCERRRNGARGWVRRAKFLAWAGSKVREPPSPSPCLCGCAMHRGSPCSCGCQVASPDYTAASRAAGREPTALEEESTQIVATQVGWRPTGAAESVTERPCDYCAGYFRPIRPQRRTCSTACKMAKSRALRLPSDAAIPRPFIRRDCFARDRRDATGWGLMTAQEMWEADVRVRRAARDGVTLGAGGPNGEHSG